MNSGSFFTRIQNLFPDKHSGRYLALIFRELYYHVPELFLEIFKIKLDKISGVNLEVKNEWFFEGIDGKKCFADLVVLRGGDPMIISEIKVDDVRGVNNYTQMIDYIAKLKHFENSTFVHISLYQLPAPEKKLLAKAPRDRVVELRLSEIAKILDQSPAPMAKMICGFLEDMGVGVYREIDLRSEQKALTFFMAQALGFRHAHGLGKLYSDKSVRAIPDIIDRMYGNLEVIGDWVKGGNAQCIGTKFSRKFQPRAIYNLAGLAKKIFAQEGQGPLPGIYGQYVSSGSLLFFTNGSIKSIKAGKKNWLNIELGFDLYLDRAPIDAAAPITVALYVGFSGAKLEWSEARSSNLKKMPTEAQALERFRKLLGVALKRALANDKDSIHAKALTSFKIPLGIN